MSYIRAYEIHLFKFFHSSLVTPSLRAMSKLQLSTIATEQLAKVLPLQLRAAQQHFIHILILDCWAAAAGGTSSSLSRGITDIDEVDLPNAMRIIDLMVESKNTPEIGFPKSDLMVAARELQNRQVPSPGGTVCNCLEVDTGNAPVRSGLQSLTTLGQSTIGRS